MKYRVEFTDGKSETIEATTLHPDKDFFEFLDVSTPVAYIASFTIQSVKLIPEESNG